MSITISRIVQGLEPSATLAMSAKAKELKSQGKTIYDLSVGELDFVTPQHICEAGTAAMKSGYTKYTIVSGIPELKKAIAEKYKIDYGLEYDPSHVVVSNGAKHSLHNVFLTTLNPDDEVIVPAPYWVSYAELIKLSGAVPVIIPTEESQNFKMTAAQFEQAITPKTKMLLLCNPSNPTGTMYNTNELTEIANIVLKNNLFVVSDEIYDKLVYGNNRFVSFPTLNPELPERTIVVNGVSKTYAMTGWRIGWTFSPEHIAKKMGELQSQETSSPSSISQYAALTALTGPQDCVTEMLAAFTKRRNYVAKRIAEIDGLTCSELSGAIYVFFNIKNYLGKILGGVRIDNSEQFCLELLTQKQVATVMGSAFGCEGYVRASFAVELDILKEAFDRIAEFVAEFVNV
ncbi:MAG: pyridoxal phosphate-dependent aminotransferase [Planctomycetaceae bacterium]|jgi:aspartate aminotransferase|nr:pyridoxal phosphate-dependent aminotransferase [Planctomycetaceae bacterium]